MNVDHPSEELLSAYALDRERVAEREGVDAHLQGCAHCTAVVADYAALDALLGDELSWPEPGGPELPPPALREAAGRMRLEDEEAEEILKPYLARHAAGFVWRDLPSKRQFYTLGVVRRLAAEADRLQYSKPQHSLNLAETAIAIGGMLSTQQYTGSQRAEAIGTAWKQSANALRQLGRYGDARKSLDHAERYYRQLSLPELDLASLTFIRATIETEQQQYEIAESLAVESTAAFSILGQADLYFRSRLLEGFIAFEKRDLARAQQIFEPILAWAEAKGDATWIARGSQALGNCALERGDLTNATQLLYLSLQYFRALGVTSEEIRCRWSVALVMRRGGNPRSAASRLRAVRDEFLALGAATDAALVTLDLMDTFLELGKTRDVQRAAGNVVSMLKEHGMLTGAITAADYLKRAATVRKVTPGIIEYVRRYLRRVDMEGRTSHSSRQCHYKVFSFGTLLS